MRPETNLWIEKANQDAKTVEILIQSKEGPPEIICFHCQQAAEKFLKAFLIDKNIDFPRTHDLLMLIEKYILPFDGTFHEVITSATEITGYATSTRYPDLDDEFDINAAHEAYQAMTEIKAFILGKICNE
ncbi:MAG: HEPN domain-containing protein [Bacteroidota bacterium]